MTYVIMTLLMYVNSKKTLKKSCSFEFPFISCYFQAVFFFVICHYLYVLVAATAIVVTSSLCSISVGGGDGALALRRPKRSDLITYGCSFCKEGF